MGKCWCGVGKTIIEEESEGWSEMVCMYMYLYNCGESKFIIMSTHHIFMVQ